MAAHNAKDTRTFFTKGSIPQWDYIMTIYKDALRLKAQQKNKKEEELLKLDCWYQDELPKLIQSRKEKHVTHDELVQTMKWKLLRGKFYPQLTNLVKINTPLAVTNATKKAFKKLPKNLGKAIQALTNLKGVGPAMASAVLAAGAPECAPFMADECLLSIPEVDSLDYTIQEYLSFVRQIQITCDRLNQSVVDSSQKWTPHRVELALWTHYIVNELNPKLLESMPKREPEEVISTQNGNSENQAKEEDKDVKDTNHNKQDGDVEKLEPDDAEKSEQDDAEKSDENNQSEDTNDSAENDDGPEEPLAKKSKTD